MSFRRRLFFTVTLLIVLTMSANFVVNTLSAREYFSAQLRVLAEDAATSLAFSFSHAAKENDQAQMETMMSAVFDSGYYLSVNYFDLDGSLILSKNREVHIENVPTWFVSLVDVPLSSGSAEVQSGWIRLGEVRVVAHPGYIIRELWRATIDLFWVYCFLLVLSYGLLGLLLNYLTRPLVKLEKQALAIASEDYSGENVLPKEPEFRRLALAMNRLSARIRDTFDRQSVLTESLRKELCTDSLTKLPNRADFDLQLSAWLESTEGDTPASLCLISLEGLLEVNHEFGRDFADNMLRQCAACIRASLEDQRYAITGRHSGTDFVVFLPGMFEDEARQYALRLRDSLAQLPCVVSATSLRVIMGVAHCSQRVRAQDILSRADASLRRNAETPEEIAVLGFSASANARTASEWRGVLEAAVSEQNFSLAFQSVRGFPSPHYEVFCRIDERGELVPAASFWPLLERFGLHFEVDKLIVQRTLAYLAKFTHVHLSVNITSACALHDAFVTWLLELLKGEALAVRSRLTLEFHEPVFAHYDRLAHRLLPELRALNVRLGVDHFGLSSEVLSRLHELQLAYVKLDRRFIRNLDQAQGDRFYLRTLESACRSSDTQIIVEGVERQTQLAALESLDLRHFQGFYFGMPKNEYEFELGMGS